jgi:alpha-tubulin suppressor-like RCC1 family protein
VSPGQVGTATTWAQVAGGDESFCGTQQDRTLWCWGINDRGQFGNGATSGANAPTPAQVATSVAQTDSGELGGTHTVALPWPTPTP